MRKSFLLGVLLAAGSGLSALAYVGSGYVLFGDAEYISPGNASNRAVKLIADVAGGEPFSGIDFGLAAGLTVADIGSLSTDTFFPAGSSCKDGSPRFQIRVPETGPAELPPPNGDPSGDNIFVYIGPPPGYTGCPSGVWSNTGNLVDAIDTVDTTQLGGTFYDPWANVVATYGSLAVTGVLIVADEFTGPQTVLIDNTNIDGTLHDYEFDSKEDCKKNGWKLFTNPPGPFKNQGQCVSYFAKQ